MNQTPTSDNPWAIYIPEPGTPYPSTPSSLGPFNDPAGGTVLARVTELLAARPKISFRLANGERFTVSLMANSPVSKPMIEGALNSAERCYAYNSPPGCRRSGNRIKRLVLGIAELLQAEFAKDLASDADEFQDELQATLWCLKTGFREGAEMESAGVADTGLIDVLENDLGDDPDGEAGEW